jgi:glycosyltransferase involved in cell wall biosynthesis
MPIDLIHAHSALPCGHAAMLLGREINVPYVVSVHGLDAYSTRQVSGRPGEWCRRVSKAVFHSAKRVLCISEHVREQVLPGAPECKTAVVYNGADPALFSPVDPAPEPPRIMSVGNLIPIKGHAMLLHAIAAIGPKYPPLECELVGSGPEESHLRALSRELGLDERVHFLGRQGRKAVADLLRLATLFVLPSAYEGLGCVYLEAMSTGLAAIGCRGQGIEEVIQHGLNGWLVAPGNLAELAQGIATLLDDPQLRSQMGARARTTIVQGFTIEHQAQRLLQIYRECIT